MTHKPASQGGKTAIEGLPCIIFLHAADGIVANQSIQRSTSVWRASATPFIWHKDAQDL